MSSTDTFLVMGTQQRVLDIPEILELVLSFLDVESNISNALVCRRWYEVALNHIWRDVSDMRKLLSLLAPMISHYTRHERSYRDEFIFARTLDVNNWERFKPYARRVRSLSLDESDGNTPISKEVFDEIGRARTTLNVLPNLRSLTWITGSVERMRLSLLFQHENITDFTVYLHHSRTYPIRTFFQEIMLRMPQLRVLDLRFEFPARGVEADLIELFLGLPRLSKVILPIYTFTSKIFEALATLRELYTVQFEFRDSQGSGDMKDVIPFDPHLDEWAFPALADLSLSARLADTTRLLHGGFAPHHLTSLYVHILSPSTPSEVSDFLTAVTDNCKVLERLFLDFFISPDIRPDLSVDPITWETLRPVLGCAHLVEFEVRWDRAFEITPEDIEEMATHWPEIQTLLLNCEPMHIPTPSQLDLRALVPFARHCPRLTELGLYIPGAVDFDPAEVGPMRPFQSLQRLCFGTSPLSDPGPAALFLSQLCPLGCSVSSGVTWPDRFGVREDMIAEDLDEFNDQATKWFQNWSEVDRTLPLLTQLRVQERNQRAALEREAQDMKMRLGVIAGREKAAYAPKTDGQCVVC